VPKNRFRPSAGRSAGTEHQPAPRWSYPPPPCRRRKRSPRRRAAASSSCRSGSDEPRTRWPTRRLSDRPPPARGQACMGLFVSSGFSSPFSRGRIRAAGRSPAVPRDRARRWLAACRPISILQGCPASCRARRGIRPVERSAPRPLLPNGWAVATGAAPAPWVVGRVACPRAGRRPDPWADAAWGDVAPAARQRSAVPRGGSACPGESRGLGIPDLLLSIVTVTFPGRLFFGLLTVLCSEAGKAVLHPVACAPVRAARGRGQGTQTLAALGGVPPPAFAGAGFSEACVSQRLDA
jgi:hypothetical protein